MFKRWMIKIKKHVAKWWGKIRSNKLHLSLLVLSVLFVFFALLSNFVPKLAIISFLFMIAMIVAIGYYCQKKHKENKRRFLVAMHKDMLTEKEIKGIKRELRSLKVAFVVLYLIAITLLVSVFNGYTEMF